MVGHVLGMRSMGRRELYLGNLKKRYHFIELDVDGIIIVKCIFKKCVGIVSCVHVRILIFWNVMLSP